MIRVEHDGRVARIVLARPDKRNALTPDMLGALRAGAAEAAGTAGALVLCGEGAVFCAGFDLVMCRDAPDGSVMRALLAGLSEVIEVLRALPVPVVVAAHGAAIAGGCALLGGADVVVADRAAKIGYPVVRIGVSPAVSAPFLRLAVGNGRCRVRQLDPGLVSGVEAARLGLVHELVDQPEGVGLRAAEIARALADKPAHAYAATKAWLNEVDGLGASPARALNVSLALAGSTEEQRLLNAALKP